MSINLIPMNDVDATSYYLTMGKEKISQAKRIMAWAEKDCLSDAFYYEFMALIDTHEFPPPQLMQSFWAACRTARAEILRSVPAASQEDE